MHISIEPVIGRPLTRMRRIGVHGNDLDAVEKFSSLSRRICAQRPAPEIAAKWLEETRQQRRSYGFAMYMIGHFLGSFGFALLFGGSLADALCSGVCGLLVGIINRLIDSWGGNQFFRIIAAAFPMALLAYGMDALHLSDNTDCVIIGALMLLVPGLLFTNAMRDIIFGDTNSGINRIVQVLLIAVAIALGTAAAWRCSAFLWGTPAESVVLQHNLLVHCFAAFVGCIGFTILFNIHGWGSLLCVLAGVLAWLTYLLTLRMGSSDLTAYFFATLVAAAYSEAMARIRKFPAISYLVVGIFPLIPGAGVYYTMNHAVQGRMDQFASQGMHTAAIAGIMAVGILMVSTTVRIITTLRRRRKA
jgi:uncharacterized membrane protein YjjP (DUF1212 family)